MIIRVPASRLTGCPISPTIVKLWVPGLDWMVDIFGSTISPPSPTSWPGSRPWGYDPKKVTRICTSSSPTRDQVKMSTRKASLLSMNWSMKVGTDAARFPDAQGRQPAGSSSRSRPPSRARKTRSTHTEHGYVRSSIGRKAEEKGVARGDLTTADLSLLKKPEELALLKHLSQAVFNSAIKPRRFSRPVNMSVRFSISRSEIKRLRREISSSSAALFLLSSASRCANSLSVQTGAAQFTCGACFL